MIEATCFFFTFLPTIIMTTPTINASGASVSGLSAFAHSALETSQPVAVVPMFAPMMTVIACARFAIIQSSSASQGILLSLAASGLVPFNAAVFIIMGQNIGTIASSMIHLESGISNTVVPILNTV